MSANLENKGNCGYVSSPRIFSGKQFWFLPPAMTAQLRLLSSPKNVKQAAPLPASMPSSSLSVAPNNKKTHSSPFFFFFQVSLPEGRYLAGDVSWHWTPHHTNRRLQPRRAQAAAAKKYGGRGGGTGGLIDRPTHLPRISPRHMSRSGPVTGTPRDPNAGFSRQVTAGKRSCPTDPE